ncbi:MAG TPA: thiamine pyrophosphate-dependent enzyme [Pirellulales bacterium]|nr:thiamine pyrophosphate-dependent enzyme [Pirellulales bacterium]
MKSDKGKVESRKWMPLVPALEVVAALRRDQIVVTTMGSAREWPKLSQHPLDFHYLPSAMGQAPLLGLGLALAQPDREVIAFNGDGCMLMNLGCLVTIAASRASNFTLVLLENGIYEVTGGQATPAAAANAPHVDFAAIARAAGIASVFAFDDLAVWKSQAAQALASTGPRFISLCVAAVGADYHLPSMPPMRDRIAAFCQALGA